MYAKLAYRPRVDVSDSDARMLMEDRVRLGEATPCAILLIPNIVGEWLKLKHRADIDRQPIPIMRILCAARRVDTKATTGHISIIVNLQSDSIGVKAESAIPCSWDSVGCTMTNPSNKKKSKKRPKYMIATGAADRQRQSRIYGIDAPKSARSILI